MKRKTALRLIERVKKEILSLSKMSYVEFCDIQNVVFEINGNLNLVEEILQKENE
jgi:hypothetical protein